VTIAVSTVLSSRLPGEAVGKPAARLPEELEEGTAGEQSETEAFGVEEPHERVAELTGGRALAVEQHAEAVLTTVADTVFPRASRTSS
jgi:uncharacterized protein (DUF2267 family)